MLQSLAECTQPMDPTVWNAYQIVSNRARAICYAARQQQFRMKTEMTVNTLVHTTQGQLMAMKKIEASTSFVFSTNQRTPINRKMVICCTLKCFAMVKNYMHIFSCSHLIVQS